MTKNSVTDSEAVQAGCRSEADVKHWAQVPSTEAEQSLPQVADWGPAEEWSDWAEETG